ncbi:MAG TPA: DUF3107 domain-containing protein [Pseudoclavibacter sp.]|nr:DUF3107 domain-containing protein [Pseudoclavibacter sp.]
MDVRIGIQNQAREIVVETSADPAELADTIAAAIAKDSPTLRLSDDKGRQFIIPTRTIGYIEVGAEETRRIGFGS